MEPVYEFEEPLLNISARIYPSGKKFRVKSEKFSHFHDMKLRYDSLGAAKEALGKAILICYVNEYLGRQRAVQEIEEVTKKGEAGHNQGRSLEGWLDKLNRADCDW